MDTHSLREFLLVFGRPLDREFPVDAALPHDIKLWLERLRLEEHLREAGRQSTPGDERKAVARA